MDDITFVRSHWWLVSEGFSLSTANSDVQKLPAPRSVNGGVKVGRVGGRLLSIGD